ncbi:hypothetical protein M2401_006206 [Pseudomonas sp. JUb42]|uniref:hypothetical protein n=1 Tax=Pseudomonas sp. JUb42 TaxID=2940611 RepID=UPI00216A1484|nr:hypothetical protein [Pseudomonas sp. JUb42]MCS3472442.1 hypothetical protein [Pseudomonas sp. JUb42]
MLRNAGVTKHNEDPSWTNNSKGFQMLYEKKTEKEKSVFVQPLVLVTLFLSVGIAFAVLASRFPDKFWEFRLFDIFTLIAQTATAGAFYIGFRQYGENKLKDRQTALSVECRALVTSMSELLEKMPDSPASPHSYTRDFTKLCNQAGDFREIFSAMREDIIKGIARMHWQDMYFNEFRPYVQGQAFFTFLSNAGIDKDVVRARLARLSNQINPNISDEERSSTLADLVISDPEIADKLHTTKWYWLDSVYEEFFNNKNLNDFLYGTKNRADMYIEAPLLYSLYKLRKKVVLGTVITPSSLR